MTTSAAKVKARGSRLQIATGCRKASRARSCVTNNKICLRHLQTVRRSDTAREFTRAPARGQATTTNSYDPSLRSYIARAHIRVRASKSFVCHTTGKTPAKILSSSPQNVHTERSRSTTNSFATLRRPRPHAAVRTDDEVVRTVGRSTKPSHLESSWKSPISAPTKRTRHYRHSGSG